MNIGLAQRDLKNEEYWINTKAKDFKNELARKRNQTDRFRFCTRGEPFATSADVMRVYEFVKAVPETDFWAPTRSWRTYTVFRDVVNILLPLDNFYLTCSIDPSTTQKEFDYLDRNGFSTGFFGDSVAHPFLSNPIKCPNKWGNKSITCANCNVACFIKPQTHHWLKEH